MPLWPGLGYEATPSFQESKYLTPPSTVQGGQGEGTEMAAG